MYPLFETIRLEGNMALNLKYHFQRMSKSAYLLFNEDISFLESLSNEIGLLRYQERHRCKVYYNLHEYKLEISKYNPQHAAYITFITDDDLEYSLKFSNRQCIEKHVTNLREGEVPIFVKNSLVSDSNYANIALWNGREWLTPDTPLLRGTKRQFLLDKNLIKEASIHVEDMYKYPKLMLINAMLDWEERVISL